MPLPAVAERTPPGSGPSTFPPAPLQDSFEPSRAHPARTLAQALTQAQELLSGPALDEPQLDSFGGNTVTRDPMDVNAADDRIRTSTRFLQATKQVRANAGLEAQAYGKLSKADQQRYQAVMKELSSTHDPVAQLSLQTLLLSGQLPGKQDLVKGGTTLQHLAHLATTTTLARGLKRGDLLSEVVQELATPSAIDQGQVGTCAPTSVAVQLARSFPAEYVRLIDGIADRKARVALKSGMVLAREPNTRFDDGTQRSTSQRLLGSALMEIGNADRNYENQTKLGGLTVGDGATAASLGILYGNLMGKPMDSRAVGDDASRSAAMKDLDTQLSNGLSVPVGLDWGGGGHEVLITGKTETNGQTEYALTNPWGREERISSEALRSRLIAVTLNPDFLEPAKLELPALPVVVRG